MNMKVLFLLALTLLAAISTIATVAITLKTLAPASSSKTEMIPITRGSANVQPLGDLIGDPTAGG